MKKMKTVFTMNYDENNVPTMGDIRPESSWVFTEPGVIATIKFDGQAVAIIDGNLFTRFDAKPGRKIPAGAIPCDDPDPITGHWPHWAPVTDDNQYLWVRKAYENSNGKELADGTYEACGPHFQSNPQGLAEDRLIKHGSVVVTDLPEVLTKENLREYFVTHPNMEGLVFYGADGKMAKLRMSDFGLPWRKKHK